MTNYRLERRFTLLAVGINLVLAGIAAFIAFVVPTVGAWICGVLTLLFLAHAAWLWLRPPVVVRLSRDGIRVGGRLTTKPFAVGWREVEGVKTDERRLYLERGEESTLVVPLSMVGSRWSELLREIYDRLNEAHGYRRFDPS